MNLTKNYRVNQVADILSVSKSQVWHLTKIGELKSIKLSDRVTVWSEDTLQDYINRKSGADTALKVGA